MHRGFFGGGVDLVVAELGIDVVAGFELVVDQKRRLVIRSHAIPHLFPKPVVERLVS